MGGYEPNPVPWAVGGFPKDFNYKTLPPDFDHFEQLVRLAVARVPALAASTGVPAFAGKSMR